MSDPFPLQYAPAVPRWRKRLRRILIGVVLAIVGVAGWRWGPYFWRQAHILYWQRQCLNFSQSPQAVVYEESPALAAGLLRQPNYYPCVLGRRSRTNRPGPTVQAASFVPRCWQSFGALIGVRWRLPRSVFATPWGGPAAIIFLHERTSPAGHRRLVCIDYYAGPGFDPDFVWLVDYDTYILVPAAWTRPAIDRTRWYPPNDIPLGGGMKRDPFVRIYAGQCDPNDPAHFTIRYQMWGQEDTLDGRLLDSDQVTLTPRNSPKMPAN
ncbi:MAG TPA: hypothetical protein VMD30_12190 [Tepidisphaeraceae bacterium]|nr:hypothetical protein [Tepidisphaeraceae bacterium]